MSTPKSCPQYSCSYKVGALGTILAIWTEMDKILHKCLNIRCCYDDNKVSNYELRLLTNKSILSHDTNLNQKSRIRFCDSCISCFIPKFLVSKTLETFKNSSWAFLCLKGAGFWGLSCVTGCEFEQFYA